jgi:hypothetical protein
MATARNRESRLRTLDLIRGSTPVDDFIPLLRRAQFTVNEKVVVGVSAPSGLIAEFRVFRDLINSGLMAYAL